MAKKLNQALLNEELKRFKTICEYTFYTEEPKRDDDDLILGNVDEVDQDPTDDSKTAANSPDGVPDGGPNPTAQDPNNTFGAPTGDQPSGLDNAAAPVPTPAPVPAPAPVPTPAPAPEMGGDETEVDVTELVQGSEEAKHAAAAASKKTSALLAKFSELEMKLDSMAAISHKIDSLEQEIVKRNPTPVEKLNMRSLDSYPYNIKLSDFWKDADGYDVTSKPDQAKEYVLTKDDVDSGFTDSSIKNSFNVTDDYEEEEF